MTATHKQTGPDPHKETKNIFIDIVFLNGRIINLNEWNSQCLINDKL